MFNKILWATDGSPESDHALEFVRDLAADNGASVVVFHVRELLGGSRAAGQPVHADEDDLAAKIRSQADELAGAGIDVTTRTISEYSKPAVARAIVDGADAADTDLIVAGTRGHTAVGGLLLGSVTNRLLHVSDRPVLVVPVRAAVRSASQGATRAPHPA